MEEFKFCSDKFKPYVQKVLDRLPEEAAMKLKSEVEIITPDESEGMHFYFKHPRHHLVYLKQEILKEPEFQIVHLIAHEFAHAIAHEDGFGLKEREAEELVKRWGFERESALVDYHRPMLESEGYKLGREWAMKQDKEWLVTSFEEYIEAFNQGELTGSRLDELVYTLDVTSVLAEMGALDVEGKSLTKEEIEERMQSDDFIPDGSMSLEKGVIFGVMSIVKELKR